MTSLQVLVSEAIAIERQLATDRDKAETARLKSVEARQRLDAANAVVSTGEGRLDATRAALHAIAGRDEITEDILDQLLDNERGTAK